MEITKIENESECFDISFSSNDRKFLMCFGGDGDLYWAVSRTDGLPAEEIDFEITKENYFLYEKFLELYNRIEDCKVFEVMPLELELCDNAYERKRLCDRVNRSNECLKKEKIYSMLFSGNVISWHSDEDNYDVASVVEIRKKEDSFSLVFKPSLYEEKTNFVSIRFRNSGSTYKPFNILFMNMYNALCEHDFNCYQIHFEEYLYKQKIKKKEK